MKKLSIFIFALLGAALVFVSAAEKLNVSGKVTDSDGNALSGVSVIVKDIRRAGATTDSAGKYSVSAHKGDTLQFFLAGYLEFKAVAAGPRLDVSLEPEKIIPLDCGTDKENTQVFADRDDGTGFSEKAMASEVVISIPNLDPTLYAAEKGIAGSDANVRPVVTMRGGRSLPFVAEREPRQQEEYTYAKENRFMSVKKAPLSTFSLEADGASYSNARRVLNGGAMPDPASVRVEEFILTATRRPRGTTLFASVTRSASAPGTLCTNS